MRLESIVIFSLCVGASVSQFLKLPENIAGKTGSSVVIPALTNDEVDSYALLWYRRAWTETASPGPQIYNKPFATNGIGVIQDGFTEDYEVSPDELHSLHVKSLSYRAAGKYTMQHLNGEGSLTALVADLIVLGPLASTGYPDGLEEGDTPSLECSVDYAMVDPDTYGPVMQWYRDGLEVETTFKDDADPTPAPDQIRSRTYFHNFTADASHDNAVFECRLGFTDRLNDLDPPTYTENVTTSFRVRYATNSLEFSPSPDDHDDNILRLSVGDVINCTANGNPEPEYIWTKIEGNEGLDHQVLGNQLKIDKEEMTLQLNKYNCTAQNTPIPGQPPRTVMKQVVFNVVMSASGCSSLTSFLFLTSLLSFVGFFTGRPS